MSVPEPTGDLQPPKPARTNRALVILGWMAVAGVLILAAAGAYHFVADEVIEPELTEAKENREVEQIAVLRFELVSLMESPAKQAQLRDADMLRLQGSEFWTVANQRGVFDQDLNRSLVSQFQDQGATAPVPAGSVSYTAPKAGGLNLLAHRTGENRAVLFTWKARLWGSAGADRVPVVWTDGNTPEWFSFSDAERDWSITRAQWDDPAGKLFGKKAPFQFTYE